MNFAQAMAALQAAGTEQNVKIYRKHGARGDLFGVSAAALAGLRKKIKVDHALAEQLWESGNMDARVLATMVADPTRLTRAGAVRWVNEADYHVLADYVAALMARAPFAGEVMEEWMASPQEYVRQVGYAMLTSRLKDAGDRIDDLTCRSRLATIEREIHTSPNRARYAMNNALIAIGIYRPNLTAAAVETAERIGRVEVDHGDTSCKTPDAAAYIKKALGRKETMKQ